MTCKSVGIYLYDLDRLFCACAREVPNSKSADGLEEAAFFNGCHIYIYICAIAMAMVLYNMCTYKYVLRVLVCAYDLHTHMINNASPQILYPEAWNPHARKKQTLVLALCIPEPISTSNPTGPIAALLDRSL